MLRPRSVAPALLAGIVFVAKRMLRRRGAVDHPEVLQRSESATRRRSATSRPSRSIQTRTVPFRASRW